MKNLKINLKKTKKSYRYTFYLVFLLYLVSVILISKSLLMLSGIETLLRIILIIILLIALALYLVSNLAFLILKRHKKVVIGAILFTLFSLVNLTGFYYINYVYNILDGISKDDIIYTTNLIALSSNKNIKTVGMISSEDDLEGYILPMEFILDNKKDYKVEFYNEYSSMIDDLYEGMIDGLFITGNYSIVYSELYPDIKYDTKVIEKYSKKMKNQDLVIGSNKSVTEPFTVLLIGVDSEYDGLSQNSAFNGDALMLISFNPKTQSAVMFGIPRDTFVPIACNNNKENKINSAAGFGTKCMINTIENFTGLGVDYYVKMNFKGVVDLVEALGGVDVDVPEPDYKSAYCVQDSNRIEGRVCLKPGYHTLNGEEALALARVRNAFALSDFKRVQNQQLVLKGIINKAKTLRSLNDFNRVLNAITKNLDTNIETKEMLNFYNVIKTMFFKNNLDDKEFINIEKTYLTGYNLTITGYGFTYQFFDESLEEIVNAMKVNLELKNPTIIKTFSFSVNDPYKETVLGMKYSSERKNEILPNFVNETYSFLENWNSSRGILINTTFENSNTCVDNTILSQSVSSGSLVSSVPSLTIKVCKNTTVKEDEVTTTKEIIIDEPIEDDDIEKDD